MATADAIEDRGGDACALVDRGRRDVGRHGARSRRGSRSIAAIARSRSAAVAARCLGEDAPRIVAEQLTRLVGMLGGVDAVVTLEAVGRQVGEQDPQTAAEDVGVLGAATQQRLQPTDAGIDTGSVRRHGHGRGPAAPARDSPSRRMPAVAMASRTPSAAMYATCGDNPDKTMPASVTTTSSAATIRWRTTKRLMCPLAHRPRWRHRSPASRRVATARSASPSWCRE